MMATRSGKRERDDILQYVDVNAEEANPDAFSERERAILNTVNQRVADGDSLDAIMNFVFESTRELFPCDRMGVAFLEEDGARVAAYWSRADYDPLLLERGYSEDLKGSSLEAVIQRGSIRIINDLETYLEQNPASRTTALLVREGVRSNMTCPLTVAGRHVGFLFRSSRRAGAYDRHQACLQMSMAERLGQAVEKAYHIEQLEGANHAYRELLAFVGHEVKNSVASVIMDARVLAEGYLGDLAPQQRKKVRRIIAKSEHVLLLSRDYLDLTRVETLSADPQFHEVENLIAEVVNPAVEIGGIQLEERNMRLTRTVPSSPIRAICEPELLRIAVGNLISNAIKYGKEGGEVRLKVEPSSVGICIHVWNEGIGFAPEERPLLFRPYSRLQTAQTKRIPGTGIGLYSVWRIAKLHGGEVRAESDVGHWAEFVLDIPQPPADLDQQTMEKLLSC